MEILKTVSQICVLVLLISACDSGVKFDSNEVIIDRIEKNTIGRLTKLNSNIFVVEYGNFSVDKALLSKVYSNAVILKVKDQKFQILDEYKEKMISPIQSKNNSKLFFFNEKEIKFEKKLNFDFENSVTFEYISFENNYSKLHLIFGNGNLSKDYILPSFVRAPYYSSRSVQKIGESYFIFGSGLVKLSLVSEDLEKSFEIQKIEGFNKDQCLFFPGENENIVILKSVPNFDDLNIFKLYIYNLVKKKIVGESETIEYHDQNELINRIILFFQERIVLFLDKSNTIKVLKI